MLKNRTLTVVVGSALILLQSACTSLPTITTSTSTHTMNYRISLLPENTALGALSCDRSDTGHCYFYIGQSDEPAQVLYTLTPSATSQVILPAKPVALCVRDTLIGKQDEWDACKAAGWVLGPKGLGNINANEAHTVVYVSKS